MLIKDLKKIIENLPDDMEVYYEDPNFSGPYPFVDPEPGDFVVEDDKFLISFPCVPEVD